ncbi:MAG: uroporphyrinogen decarboxylase family protein [Phycisphaeraceae bacterium]
MTTHTQVSNQQKTEVWKAYHAGAPTRVPVMLGTNPRVVILNPALNPQGITFEQAARDPRTHIEISLQHSLYRRTVVHQYTDDPMGLPDIWDVNLNVYNVYEAAIFGAAIDYSPNQVPDTNPPFSGDADREKVFDVDIEHPLDNPFIADRLRFWRELEKICADMEFEGRPVRLAPWALAGTDGPVTVAMNLRGAAFMEDLVLEPDYADRLMRFVTQAAILRRQAFWDYWGDRIGRDNGIADDSVALISTEMYQRMVLPIHRLWYEAGPAGSRGIHLCGDATRHFPLIRRELDVTRFDTGFPVDFGHLRDELGDDVEVSGGPPVALLLKGTPDQVYQRTEQILTSGIKRGGKFILREGNNLPPLVPEANLEAMYQACLDYGAY